MKIYLLWFLAGEKPFSEPMLTKMFSLGTQLTHLPPSAAYMYKWIRSALVQIMACHLFGAKSLSKPMLGYCQLDP